MRLPLIPSSFVFDDINPVNAKPIFAGKKKKSPPPPPPQKKKKFFSELVIAKKVFMQES